MVLTRDGGGAPRRVASEDPTRTILHVDLDSFYASVEQRDDPSLRGRPLIVGGPVARGVVCAASYEARRFGVHSAMPMAEAVRLCPSAVVVPPRFSRYQEASNAFFDILASYSPLVEGLSLDEAFIDVTGSLALFGPGPAIAESIRGRVSSELDLVASVGVAPSKFIAKIASDIDKPDGLRVVEPGRVLDFLHPLPLSRLWGVGRVTHDRLRGLGLTTVGDLAAYPETALCGRLGRSLGAHLHRLAHGIDDREVVADRSPVSIGHEETFPTDRVSAREIAPTLRAQADRVASRLRRANLRAGAVVLKLKFADFRQVTRQRRLPSPSSDGTVLGQIVCELLAHVEISASRAQRVRLCGVAAAALEDRDAPRQLALDEERRARGERLGDTLDAIAARFGDGLVRRGDQE